MELKILPKDGHNAELFLENQGTFSDYPKRAGELSTSHFTLIAYLWVWLNTHTGLVSSGTSLTSWGKGASLALVGHPSSDGTTIKIPFGVDVFITLTSFTPHLFLFGCLKLNLILLLDQLRLA